MLLFLIQCSGHQAGMKWWCSSVELAQTLATLLVLEDTKGCFIVCGMSRDKLLLKGWTKHLFFCCLHSFLWKPADVWLGQARIHCKSISRPVS